MLGAPTIPLVLSIFFAAGFAVAIRLAVVSLPLLSVGPASPTAGQRGTTAPRRRGGSVALLAGLFVVNGLCLLATRAFRQTGIRGEDSLFLLILFASAAGTACALPGVVVGAANALSNRFIVIALQRLPGIIVYPFYSALGLLVRIAITRAVFREKVRPVEGIGMAFAVGSIVFVNMA